MAGTRARSQKLFSVLRYQKLGTAGAGVPQNLESHKGEVISGGVAQQSVMSDTENSDCATDVASPREPTPEEVCAHFLTMCAALFLQLGLALHERALMSVSIASHAAGPKVVCERPRMTYVTC